MTIDIGQEKDGMRLTALIITGSTETHSAIQEIPPDKLELFKKDVQDLLVDLIDLASAYKKTP